MSTCKYTLLFHLRFCLHLETATIGQMCPLAPTADQKVVLQMGLPREWNTAITVHISCPDYMVHFSLLAPGSSRHCPFPWLSAGCFVLCSQLGKANCTVTLSRTQGNKFNCFKSNAVLLCMKTNHCHSKHLWFSVPTSLTQPLVLSVVLSKKSLLPLLLRAHHLQLTWVYLIPAYLIQKPQESVFAPGFSQTFPGDDERRMPRRILSF